MPRRPAGRRAHPPRAPRGGRGQARPRRRERAHPRLRRERSSTSTAAARRSRRSSPSPTCAPPSRRASGCSCCARRCASSACSDVNMEEGSLRCDANISHPPGRQRRARHEDRAEEHELVPLHRARHRRRDRAPGRRSCAAGEQVVQETLHFDPRTGAITSLRSKEEAHDYRYFPEPDLVPVAITRRCSRRARAALPELPAAREERYCERARPQRRQRAAARRPRRARRLLRGRRCAADGAEPQPLANWVTASSPRAWTRADPADSKVDAGGARPRSSGWSPTKAITSARRARCSTSSSPRAATRGDRRGRGPGARWATATSSRAIVAAALAANADAAEKIRAGNMKAIGADHRPRHAGDQGPRRRRRGHAASSASSSACRRG